ncbi:MAG: hypothetical protein K5753_05160 [Clostridia bacterium]|nr:hypothetical protein [Clostridia bacterium]
MENVLEIVASVMRKDKAFLKENLDTENLWNSLTKVEIILSIEEECDILFEQEEVKEITTLRKLLEVVEAKEA